MTDGQIIHTKGGGVMLTGSATEIFRVASLKGSIKLMSAGIRIRGMTLKRAFGIATTYTGNTYKRTEASQAIADLDLWLETARGATEVINQGD